MDAVRVGAVITQPDRPAGRGERLQMSPVKVAALKHGLKVLQPERIRKQQKAFLAELSALDKFDIGVVTAFGQLLPQAVLELPRRGCINIHASLLPRWRGAAPIQRALMAGDSETGVCLMHMEAGLDSGPVYSRVSLPIETTDDFGSLHDKLASAGAALLRRDLAAILRGDIGPQPQPEAGVAYAHKIENHEAQIDWNQPARIIALQIRALSPYPGAFTFLRGKRLKILRAGAEDEIRAAGIPGQIALIDKHRLEILCGDGLLAIHEAQLEGRSRQPVAEFMRGAGLDTATVLGNHTG